MELQDTRSKIKKINVYHRVAFDLRCAQRLSPLFGLPQEIPNGHFYRSVVSDVLSYAKDFAEGEKSRHTGDTIAAAKTASSIYSEMVMTAKDLAGQSLPKEDNYYDLQALAATYQLAGDYVMSAVAAEEIEERRDPLCEYPDESLVDDYGKCSGVWGFRSAAQNAAHSDLTALMRLQEASSRRGTFAVDPDFFETLLWPDGEPPTLASATERQRRTVSLLGQAYNRSRRVLEAFDGFVERIDGDVAHVSLRPETTQRLLFGRYSTKELAAQGIFERRRFRCETVDLGGKVAIDLVSIPDKEVSAERQREIQQRIRDTLEGEDLDNE
jgi:hypothetical protein